MQKHWCNNQCFCMFMRGLCVFVCERGSVCWWSCLKESSSDGAWKPCSTTVLPVHRQLHCWAHNTRSALTPARTLCSPLSIFLSVFVSLHPLPLLIWSPPSQSLHRSNSSFMLWLLHLFTDFTSMPWPCLSPFHLFFQPNPEPLLPGWSPSPAANTAIWLNALLIIQS